MPKYSKSEVRPRIEVGDDEDIRMSAYTADAAAPVPGETRVQFTFEVKHGTRRDTEQVDLGFNDEACVLSDKEKAAWLSLTAKLRDCALAKAQYTKD